jgi:hypothetical protein
MITRLPESPFMFCDVFLRVVSICILKLIFFYEPFAGYGAIVSEFRCSSQFREFRWFGSEINLNYENDLLLVCDDVRIADCFDIEWPDSHIVTNPPFRRLDELWPLCSKHRDRFGKSVSVFMPVAWWNAEKRQAYIRPDIILSLGWRPVFRKKNHRSGS